MTLPQTSTAETATGAPISSCRAAAEAAPSAAAVATPSVTPNSASASAEAHAAFAAASKPLTTTRARRLPVQRAWPPLSMLAVQSGILIVIVAAWEIGADTGYVDAFFWSQPSAIWHTLTIFFTTGDAFTDIAFTFRST